MTKAPKLAAIAADGLTARERVLLFCAASGTDWHSIGLTRESVTAMVVKFLIVRDAAGQLSLTDHGRAVLRILLPDP